MCNTILGRKLGMTQVWSDDDQLVPVTVIQAGPCVVTQIKTDEKEGYSAVQIGFGELKAKKLNKPMAGHFSKANVEPSKVLREVRVDDAANYELGQEITVEQFAETKKVDVSGVSKGKGFAGVMKRYNFKGGPGGHGSHFHRAPGSVGQCATPSRVFKGLRLPGHMGVDKVTVKNLEVVKVDAEQNLLLVKGAVPGGKGALVSVRTV
ncbi:MAG: 50S ribosomal protein L3 [Coriobacteriia bacterium]|jgi:large subunit ribosomal protein L3|nr:50S ribosomal protein L3 [Coriobacteriia bacterium]MDR2714500.1 50S ribosomal protein L3 [Coriobacteriales bacterium]